MSNLTIAVEDELLRRARRRALDRGTSVNALLRDYLEAFARSPDDREIAIRSLLDLSKRARSGRAGKRFTREDLHER